MDDSERLLRDSIEYLQQRLNFVNDKANIFVALQTGLFVVLTWLFGTFFLPFDSRPVILSVQLLYLLMNFGFIIVIVALLLQTIRPSDGYLSLKTNVTPLNTKGVMWPGEEIPDEETFTETVESLTQSDINRELAGTVYVLQQLVKNTYQTYRWSILLMKVQIIVVPSGFALLVVLEAVV